MPLLGGDTLPPSPNRQRPRSHPRLIRRIFGRTSPARSTISKRNIKLALPSGVRTKTQSCTVFEVVSLLPTQPSTSQGSSCRENSRFLQSPFPKNSVQFQSIFQIGPTIGSPFHHPGMKSPRRECSLPLCSEPVGPTPLRHRCPSE